MTDKMSGKRNFTFLFKTSLQRFSLECQKLVGFASLYYSIGLKRLAPLILIRSHTFSCAWLQPHVFHALIGLMDSLCPV